MKVIGLTGGIASGKSTVSAVLARHAAIVDLDALVHDLQAPGSRVVRSLAAAFPECVADGVLDRRALGAAVFGDVRKRQQLNRIMRRPITGALVTALARHFVLGTRLVVLDAPLLFEAGLHKLCALVVVVDAPVVVQIDRLRRRDGLDADAARRRLDAQMPLADKVARADVVFDNSGDLASLRRQCEDALPHLKRRLFLWWFLSLPGVLLVVVVRVLLLS